MSPPCPVLLLHDPGELDDVAVLLRTLGVPFEERVGDAASGAIPLPSDLLVATGRRALQLPPPPKDRPDETGPARIAVVSSESPRLRAGLREAGFELLVHRPVHPTALRLLLLRFLYRGPEKRRDPRVAVGSEIRYRMMLIWRRAMLVELSTGGCRLLLSRTIRAGRRILVEVPDLTVVGSPLRIVGRVIRANAVGPTDPSVAVAIEFVGLGDAERDRLQRIVAEHARGPATLPLGRELDHPVPISSEPVAELPSEEDLAAAAVEAAQPSGAERRQHPRAPYEQRVVTLGEEAAHVVMGRDLSVGGIRIEAHGGLERGQKVSLALHGGALPVPVVVKGSVSRDDGDGGLVIQFDKLSAAQRGALEKLLADLGTIESLAPGGAGGGAVVTRILPRVPVAPTA